MSRLIFAYVPITKCYLQGCSVSIHPPPRDALAVQNQATKMQHKFSIDLWLERENIK